MQTKVRKLATMAMLVAISIVLVYLIHFPIFPGAAFLEYDPADIPILIGAFAYGPVAGVLLTVVTAVIQGFTVSASSGIYHSPKSHSVFVNGSSTLLPCVK